MAAKVLIPTPLRRLTDDKSEVRLDGRTINEVVHNLEKNYPKLRNKLFDAQGNIKRFIRVFINEKDMCELNGGETPVKDGDELTLVPAAFGG